MKQMVALELEVVLLLARRARAAGLDPSRDPIPGLRRDVLFTCTADEEAGGRAGARWLADHRPETLQAGGALNECGGVSMVLAGRRFYPIQVAEKGFEVFRIHVKGTWGHGSMPRDDNAAVLASEVVRRMAVPGEPRLTEVMRRFLDAVREAVPPEQAELVDAIAGDDPRRAEAAIRALCDPMYARATRALLRDSISPDVIHAGIKYNVIPGEAMVEIDCRTLPGTTADDMREEVLARLGDLAPHCTLEHVIGRPPVDRAGRGRAVRPARRDDRAHDPEGIPVPVMAPFATDAKSTSVHPGRPDLRLRAAPARARRAVPRAVPRRRRAGGPRGAPLGPARPVRRGGRLLRLSRQASWCGAGSEPGGTSVTSSSQLVQRNRRPRPHSRSLSCAGAVLGGSSISPQDPSLWRCETL